MLYKKDGLEHNISFQRYKNTPREPEAAVKYAYLIHSRKNRFTSFWSGNQID